MPDVVLDSQFSRLPIRTGMDEMRSFATSTTRAIGKDISGMFAGAAVAAGGLAIVEGALHSIVEEAHQIHEVSEKFRIDSDALQTIGNAARDIGIPLETVASAMNKIELNAYKATQANNEQRKALEGLGLQAEEFFKLSADEKILALADAYDQATDKATAFAEVATLIGRRNTDLIRLMTEGGLRSARWATRRGTQKTSSRRSTRRASFGCVSGTSSWSWAANFSRRLLLPS